MASVLTHKKVPEWGGDSPRQRHRFCYIVDGGASFFSDLGNQNISGFRHTKQIEITKSTKYLNKFKIKNKIPQISHTQIAYMRSDGFFLQMLQREQWSNRSLPHNLRYQDPKFFGFHSDIRRKKSPDLSCTVCAPMIRGILSYLSSDPIFFLLIYFKWDPKEKKSSDLSVFRSAQPDPTVF